MKKVFRNKTMECIFTEDSVCFYSTKNEVGMPYGAIDTINMSLLGILQVTHRAHVFTFAVNRADRAAMKEMLRFTKEAMRNAPKAEPTIVDLSQFSDVIENAQSPEEELKQFKTLFIQGAISKDAYDLKKRQLQ